MGGPIARTGSAEDIGDLDGGAHRLRWAAACPPCTNPLRGREPAARSRFHYRLPVERLLI